MAHSYFSYTRLLLGICGIWILLSSHAFANTTSTEELQLYLDSPYILNPLGEGKNSAYDKRPLFREDAFDCTTYVETVLANRKAQLEGSDFFQTLMHIRYINGKIGFFTRAHIMESEWIPNAIKYNFIAPYPLKNAQVSHFPFYLKDWFEHNEQVTTKDAAYAQKAEKYPEILELSIPYVPIADITADFVKSLPKLMVVFFLKKIQPKEGQKVTEDTALVVHMGLLKEGELYHASIIQKKVSTKPLTEYLKDNHPYVGASFYEVK